MLATLLIVFREVIEAGIVIGIVLAATTGVPRRGIWITAGAIGGLLGACVVAVFAQEIADLGEGWGQEYFNATILFAASAMLTWHNVWMASQGQSMAEEARIRALGGAVAAGFRPITALAIVVGVAVLREGTEVVLLLYGILAAGNAPGEMTFGGFIGFAGGVALSALIYFGLTAIPIRRLFTITIVLITLLAAGMASQGMAQLQQAGIFLDWSAALWDTSHIIPESSVLGQLLSNLVGYSESPTSAQGAAYAAVVLLNLIFMWLIRRLKP
jgi:high-affinity iron transporter